MKSQTTLFFAALITALFFLPVLFAGNEKNKKEVDEVDLLIAKSAEHHQKAIRLNRAIDNVVTNKVQEMKAEVKELKKEVLVANQKLIETQAIIVNYENKIAHDSALGGKPFSIFAIEAVPDSANRK